MIVIRLRVSKYLDAATVSVLHMPQSLHKWLQHHTKILYIRNIYIHTPICHTICMRLYPQVKIYLLMPIFPLNGGRYVLFNLLYYES